MSYSSSLPSRALCEPLEGRLLCRISVNGDFAITPPGGGVAHETLKLHPEQGVTGLQTARDHSGGVVNWQITETHEWTPGDHSGPHQFA